MEDEEHVLFVSPLYNDTRRDHPSTFTKTLTKLLNPTTTHDIHETSKVLLTNRKHTQNDSRMRELYTQITQICLIWFTLHFKCIF